MKLKFKIAMCALTFVLAIGSNKLIPLAMSKPDTNDNPLDTLLNVSVSDGNQSGNIYSIDGEVISANDTFIDDTFSIVGSSEGGGMIYKLKNILLNNSDRINKRARQGDNVILTLHSKGMTTAHDLLAEYTNEQASICVVLRDGSIVVSTGNNTDKDIYVDYNATALAKGSSFKPLLYRVLLQHLDELPSNMDFTQPSFEDISAVTIYDRVIHNWDSTVANNYDIKNADDHTYTRKRTLADLLKLSSNTAPIRLAKELGFKKTFEYMNLYQLNSNLVTEINLLDGIQFNEIPSEKYPDFFFGQYTYISSVRMCQMYNYMISGRFFTPFYIAKIVKPDGSTVSYTADPKPREEYFFDIDVQSDLLNKALHEVFLSYIDSNIKDKYSDELLNRCLAKSGTVELDNSANNRVMMLSVLNEDRTDVLCSCCISVNNTAKNITNAQLIDKLLTVLSSMEMI